MNKSILYFLTLIFLLSFVDATLNSTLTSYWNGVLTTGDAVDLKGVNLLTDGTMDNVAGKIGNGFNYNADTDFEYMSNLALNTSFSLCMWADSSVSQTNGDYNRLFSWDTAAVGNNLRVFFSGYTADDNLRIAIVDNGGGAVNCDYSKALEQSTYFYCFIVNNTDKAVYYYLNATKQAECSYSPNPIRITPRNFIIGNKYPDSNNEGFRGWIDEVGLWNNVVLNQAQINNLYNNSIGCNPYYNVDCASAPVSDTTPPTISNVVQYPLNATFSNLANQHLLINATITDNVKVLYSNLSIKLNFTEIYINGTLYNFNLTRRNQSNSGSVHKYDIEELNILGGTYPLNFSKYMENSTHLNLTLSGNGMVKMMFLNVTGKTQANLFEIYALNTTPTGISNYYYCNSTYSSGNPSTSPYCYNFYTVNTNRPFNHTHGIKSKHKIVPLAINTSNGKVGNIKVTPTSYILKKVTGGNEAVFYVTTISRVGQSQYSNNNGVTWSNTLGSSTGTINAHLHQVYNQPGKKSAINYRICTIDNSSNSVCSIWYGDILQLAPLPPETVVFSKPIENGRYNTTLNITHTASFSATGQSIINYTYYYKQENATSYTLIATNQHPTLNYVWDISAIPNDFYVIKVIIKDSLGFSTTAFSERFEIYNPPSLDQVLLTSIDGRLEDIYNLLDEVLNMIWIVMLYLGLMFFGYWVLKSGNFYLGIAIMFGTLGFDFFFTQKIVNDYVIPNIADSWTGYFYIIWGYITAVWIFVKISLILFYKQTITKKAIA